MAGVRGTLNDLTDGEADRLRALLVSPNGHPPGNEGVDIVFCDSSSIYAKVPQMRGCIVGIPPFWVTWLKWNKARSRTKVKSFADIWARDFAAFLGWWRQRGSRMQFRKGTEQDTWWFGG